MTLRILIADDHTIVRDGLRTLLEASPEVQIIGTAASGRMAVNQARELTPDIILMDIGMPDLNGVEATRQVLEAVPHAQVVILSMSGDPEHIFLALDAGARGYLLKESAGREVLKAVQAVHAGECYLSQPVLQALITDYLRCRADPDSNDPLRLLSDREQEVFHGVVRGKTSAEIAQELFLSPKTVETYRSRIMHKLGMPDLPTLMRFAIERGLVD